MPWVERLTTRCGLKGRETVGPACQDVPGLQRSGEVRSLGRVWLGRWGHSAYCTAGQQAGRRSGRLTPTTALFIRWLGEEGWGKRVVTGSVREKEEDVPGQDWVWDAVEAALPNSTAEPELIAVAVGTTAWLVHEIDPLDSCLSERHQLLRLRDSIVIPIDPQSQGAIHSVGGVDVTVAIATENRGVELGQGQIAV